MSGTTFLSNSAAASSAFHIMRQSEPLPPATPNGVYIGRTRIYGIPFFLDTDALLNPHVSIAGMSGSGKTYFLKSYMARKRLQHGCGLMIIDWNGEYDELVGFLGGTIVRMQPGTSGFTEAAEAVYNTVAMHMVTSLNLSAMRGDSERKVSALSIIDGMLECARTFGPKRKTDSIMLIDEAWKVLGEGESVFHLFREARKYGIAMALATQMVGDIDNEIMANSGCTVLFRLQGEKDYAPLMATGILNALHQKEVAALGVGTCMIHLAKSSADGQESFFIRRVEGLELSAYDFVGDSMQVKVQGTKFNKAAATFIENAEARYRLLALVEANGRKLDAVALVRQLAADGLRRRDIIPFLRAIGFDDLNAVMAYECAASAAMGNGIA